MPPAADPKLKAELKALLDEGMSTGKVPPAPNHPVHKDFVSVIKAVGDGRLTEAGIALGRQRLAEMVPLVTMVGMEHQQPMPLAIAEEVARTDGLEPYPPVDSGTELIVLPIGREMMMSRMKGWKGMRPHGYISRADWEFWGQMEEVGLWQGVLLSLDVDPRPDPDFGLSGERALEFFETALGSIQARNRHRVRERLIIAESAWRAGQFRALANGQRFECVASIADLGTWAANKGWDLPGQFPRPLKPDWRRWGGHGPSSTR